MLTTGPNLGLLDNGNYGEGTYHELLRLFRGLDALVQPHVKSAATATPPGSPVEGDCYIIPANPTGAWAGQTGKIARWTARSAAGTPVGTPSWEFFTPKKGWLVGVDDTGAHLKHNGTTWYDYTDDAVGATQENADAAAASAAAALVSEQNAAASANTASTQAASATTQASIAATQATTATTKASEASNSAGTASAQASTATTQAGIATTQAGIATTQAGIATTKAGEAASSAAALAASLEAFRTQSLGTFTEDPTVDGNGDPLQDGAEYFNSVTDTLRIYVNGAWQDYDYSAQQSTAAASLSAANAAASAGTASTQAGIATTKANEASASATAASNSAGTASAQATTATTQAGVATTQAGIATTQASIATTKAAEAAASADAAATFNPASVGITGGTINNAVIGGVTPAAGSFTTLNASAAARLSGMVALGPSEFLLANTALQVYQTAGANQQLALLNAGTYHTGFIASSSATPLNDAYGWGMYGGPNTYLHGSSAYTVGIALGNSVPGFRITDHNNLNATANGPILSWVRSTNRWELGNVAVSGYLSVNATQKIYLDGGGDTYLVESSANVLDVYAGGVNTIRTTASGTAITGSGSGAFRLSSNADGAYVAGFSAVTKGIRFSIGSTGSSIEGVDSTLTGSYQPIALNGSTVQLQAGGNAIATATSLGIAVNGIVDAGDAVATSGGVGLRLRYGASDFLNIFGSMYSSGATMLGYGVRSSTVAGNTFLSTSAAASHPRGALTMDNALRFYQANASTIAVGSTATLTEAFTVTTSGDMVTPATKKHYLDGSGGVGGDTYLVESSANVLDMYAGGSNILRLASTIATITGRLDVTVDSAARNPSLWTDSNAAGCSWYVGPGAGSGNRGDFNFYDGTNSKAVLALAKSTGDVTLNTGNLVMGTAGKGIDFSATSNGSGTTSSEVLSDYEEGTFTPALTFGTPGDLSVVHSLQVGRYTKVGNRVTYAISVTASTFTHTTAGGNFRITGLPFQSSAASNNFPMGSVGVGVGITTATYEMITPFISPSTSFIELLGNDLSGGTSSVLTPVDVASGSTKTLYITGTYEV